MGKLKLTDTITAYKDAVVHDSFKGNQFEGIRKGGVFSGFEYLLNELERKIAVLPGYATIYGRQFELESPEEFSLTALTGTKYCVIYAEVNLRNVANQYITLKLAYGGASYPNLENNDLIANKTGIARMPLYRFVYNSHGQTDVFKQIEKLFYTYEAGTYEKVRELDKGARLNGREINSLLHKGVDRWKFVERANYAEATPRLGKTAERAVKVNSNLILPEITGTPGLVQITKGYFRVSGSEPLQKGNTHRFYYRGEDLSGYFYKTRVIGVLVNGRAILVKPASPIAGDGKLMAFGNERNPSTPRDGFNNLDSIEYKPGYIANTTSIRDARPDSNMSIFGGEIYRKPRANNDAIEGVHFYLTEYENTKNAVIGVKLLHLGLILQKDDHRTGGSRVATLQFKAVNSSRPYLEVKVDQNVHCDLTFRLIYIEGDAQDATNFRNLDPALV